MNDKSLIQCLQDSGLSDKDIEEYLNYGEKGMYKQQIRLLAKHRLELLDCVHLYQKKIDCLDYFIYKIKENGGI